MFFSIAVILWCLVALGAGWTLIRFGWHDTSDPFRKYEPPPGAIYQPYILTRLGFSAQQIATISYFFATILVFIAAWLGHGLLWAIVTFIVASLVFGRIHAASRKRIPGLDQ